MTACLNDQRSGLFLFVKRSKLESPAISALLSTNLANAALGRANNPQQACYDCVLKITLKVSNLVAAWALRSVWHANEIINRREKKKVVGRSATCSAGDDCGVLRGKNGRVKRGPNPARSPGNSLSGKCSGLTAGYDLWGSRMCAAAHDCWWNRHVLAGFWSNKLSPLYCPWPALEGYRKSTDPVVDVEAVGGAAVRQEI
ncbi:hypothetical protein BC832DRAFT_537256 [Gaertneriomyces semiglobifer]|nr:hypothetical protein BC832DRAFT_537256 [Gaertneriomyces semiglobifer]